MTRLHILGTLAALFVAMFIFAAPALAQQSQAECIEEAEATEELCYGTAQGDLFFCNNACRIEPYAGCEDDCLVAQSNAQNACSDALTEQVDNVCDNIDDLRDSTGRCNFGADLTYGGCKNKDGTSNPLTTIPCTGFVDPFGKCLTGSAATPGTTAGGNLGDQFQSIQTQGLIFGNICTSRTADCDCRDYGKCELNDILQVVVNISVLILGISGSLVLIMFVYGGFLWLSSHGNENMVTEGKKTIVGAVVGLIIVFGAYTAITFFISVLKTGAPPETGQNLEDVLRTDAVSGTEGSTPAGGSGLSNVGSTITTQ